MHELYELRKKQLVPHSTTMYEGNVIEVTGLTTEIFGKTPKRWLAVILWNVITGGKAKAYVIRDSEGKIIHYSCVIPKCAKFPFLEEGDIEIGPCATNEKFRGKGLYPCVLSQIVKNELDDQRTAYMIVDNANIASIRGVTKVGFKVAGEMKKTRGGRHIVVRRYC